jgi:TetR/AcrR family transcriptional regulator, mexJK operon transcriptional repressor
MFEDRMTMLTRKSPGRPKNLEKRAAIITCAHKMFFERGLEAVRIEEIAEAAGVSKMTIYSHFPDKTALFEAVVELQSTQMERAFADLRPGDGPVDIVLTGLGDALLSFLLGPEIMRFDEVLTAEMGRHPGLGHRFFRAGPDRMWSALTAIIERAVASGELVTDDSRRAAEDLISLWLGMVPMRHRFNELPPMSNEEILERVDHGVACFIRIYGVGIRDTTSAEAARLRRRGLHLNDRS